MELLQVEREECLKARDNGTADDVVLRRVFDRLDIEESMLDREDDEGVADTGRELRTPVLTAGSCKHLDHPWKDVEPSAPDGCPECMAEGMTWVHLRKCLKCGKVGCCDSSVGKHATAHFHNTRHPVMRSYEPGETWRWCFVDQQLG
jgi:CPA1 family monovalent cation:H+ antiporter